jgi:hypothetical protein
MGLRAILLADATEVWIVLDKYPKDAPADTDEPITLLVTGLLIDLREAKAWQI